MSEERDRFIEHREKFKFRYFKVTHNEKLMGKVKFVSYFHKNKWKFIFSQERKSILNTKESFRFSTIRFFQFLYKRFLEDDPRILDMFPDFVYDEIQTKALAINSSYKSEIFLEDQRRRSKKFKEALSARLKNASSIIEEAKKEIEEYRKEIDPPQIKNVLIENPLMLDRLFLNEEEKLLSAQDIEQVLNEIEMERSNDF